MLLHVIISTIARLSQLVGHNSSQGKLSGIEHTVTVIPRSPSVFVGDKRLNYIIIYWLHSHLRVKR